MSELKSKTITGEEMIEETQTNGNIPALAINKANNHGILDIDLTGYSMTDHIHDEYVRRDEALQTGLKCDVLLEGPIYKIGTYQLKASMEKYKFIVFTVGAYNGVRYVVNDSIVVYVPNIQYNTIDVGATCWSHTFYNGSNVCGKFLSENTIYLQNSSSTNPGWPHVDVRQVIGIS